MFFRKKNTPPTSAAPIQNAIVNSVEGTAAHPIINREKLINTVQHLAVIMDGNGRWAQKRNLPRVMGHVRGVQTVRQLVKNCVKYQIKSLTLFAFSSENWRRPEDEVSFLMRLFVHTLKREFIKLYNNNILLNLIGDISVLEKSIQAVIHEIIYSKPPLTQPVLTLNIAINYGGQNDIIQAIKQHLLVASTSLSTLAPDEFLANIKTKIQNLQPSDIAKNLALHQQPAPDLMIRTGGEQRISNFLLWQLAYAELYFTDCFWPAFNEEELCKALDSYQKRERRFGHTSAQILENKNFEIRPGSANLTIPNITNNT